MRCTLLAGNTEKSHQKVEGCKDTSHPARESLYHSKRLIYFKGNGCACREVLVMVMRKHQRYFPVYEASGEALLPHFITVANGQIDVPTVRAGMPPAPSLI